MPLYCYIVETGMYEDVSANILGHENKYNQDEFDNICIEITKKYGDVEEIEYFSNYDLSDVKEIKYNIPGEKLIEYLISDYGFVELGIPINDGHNTVEVSRKPVPKENLRIVKTETPKCPHSPELSEMMFCNEPDTDFKEDIGHINCRCNVNLIKKDQ